MQLLVNVTQGFSRGEPKGDTHREDWTEMLKERKEGNNNKNYY